MGLLARADRRAIERLWRQLGLDPAYRALRGPEVGAIAVRGRVGGDGAPFNFGEATVCRATVEVEGGAIGHAAILGRDARKCALAAVIDALAEAGDADIESGLLEPLRILERETDRSRAEEVAATKVEFFTLARETDG